VDMDKFAKTGLSTDIFSSGGTALMQDLAELGVSICLNPNDNVFLLNPLQFLPEDLSCADLEAYMNCYLEHRPAVVESTFGSMSYFIRFEDTGRDAYGGISRSDSVCMMIASLENAVQQRALADLTGVNMEMFPITQSDGSVTADISMYGAVNANCDNPDAAYDLLSNLLTEDVQWEKQIAELGHPSMMANGYPVLTADSVQPIFNLANAAQYDNKLQEKVNEMEISDTDIPLLSMEVKARFPIGAEYEIFKKMKNTISLTPEKIQEFAEEWVENYRNTYGK